jgi:pilus assembly protein CpaB
LVAGRELEMRSILSTQDLVTRTIRVDAAPEGYLVDPVQAVGRVLVVPVVEGQALTETCFASQGTGVLLAAALAEGKRAVSVSLSDSMGIEPLLYAGSLVDVISSIEMDGDELGRQPISFTLLREVLVLAVGVSTVVDPGGDDDARAGNQRRPSVTLLLTPDEAQALKLATERGSISISMRNPMEQGGEAPETTDLSQLSPEMAAARERALVHARQVREDERKAREEELEKRRFDVEQARNEAELARLKYELDKRKLENQDEESKHKWEVLILRGGTAETRTFNVNPTDEDGR